MDIYAIQSQPRDVGNISSLTEPPRSTPHWQSPSTERNVAGCLAGCLAKGLSTYLSGTPQRFVWRHMFYIYFVGSVIRQTPELRDGRPFATLSSERLHLKSPGLNLSGLGNRLIIRYIYIYICIMTVFCSKKQCKKNAEPRVHTRNMQETSLGNGHQTRY